MRCFTSISIKAAFITASPVAVLERLIPLCQLPASRGRCNLYWGLILNVLSCTGWIFRGHQRKTFEDKVLRELLMGASHKHPDLLPFLEQDVQWPVLMERGMQAGPLQSWPTMSSVYALEQYISYPLVFFLFVFFSFFFQALARGNNLFSFYSSNWNRGDCTHQLRLQDQAPGFVKPHVVDLCW